jgi:uncharacterized protein (TIGR03663 family)
MTLARSHLPEQAIASSDDHTRRRSGDAPKPTLELFGWLFVVLVAAGLRLIALDQSPLNQAEGGRALQSWLVAGGRLQDTWPGGAIDAVTAALFRLFGSGDATARLAPALAGVALVGSLSLLRPHLGRAATLLAAVVVALSPVFVYDARSVGGASAGAALSVSLTALVLRWLCEPRPRTLVLICSTLAFGLGTDAVFLGSTLLIGAWLALRGGLMHSRDVTEAWFATSRTRGWLVNATPAVLAGLLLAVSRFGTGFARLRPAAAADWSLAFTPSRPGVAWHYALDVLAGYGAPLLLLAAGGAFLIIRGRSWRERPLHGLAVTWAGGGLVICLFAAGRYPSTLLLVCVPLALLAGHALERATRAVAGARPDAVDLLLATGLLVGVFYTVIIALSRFGAGTATSIQLLAGFLLVAICLGGAVVRWEQDGFGIVLPIVAVTALVLTLADLRGDGAIRGAGDEFLAGQRTTPEGRAFAGVLVRNGGGVSSVTDESVRPLAWYLRDTVRSGGHDTARLIAAAAPTPAGFYDAGQATVIARSWSPGSWSANGMIRWWVYRQAWGTPRDVTVKLVVEGR